jgi:hypothetical protein
MPGGVTISPSGYGRERPMSQRVAANPYLAVVIDPNSSSRKVWS